MCVQGFLDFHSVGALCFPELRRLLGLSVGPWWVPELPSGFPRLLLGYFRAPGGYRATRDSRARSALRAYKV